MRKAAAAVICLLLPLAAWPAAAIETSARLPQVPALELGATARPAADIPAVDAAELPSSLTLPPSAPEAQAEASAPSQAPSAAAAAGGPKAADQLAGVQEAVVPPSGSSEDADPSQASERADQAWSGAPETPSGAPTPEPPAPQRSRGLLRRAAPVAVTLLGAASLAPTVLDHGQGVAAHLPQIWHQAAPYAGAAAGIGGVYYLSRLARWAVTKIGTRAGWNENRIVVTRLLASAGTWIVGGLAALQAFGIPAQTVFASLGVGSLAVSIAATDVVGNLFEAVKVLTVQPFRSDDTIVVGGDDGDKYTVKRFALRYLNFLKPNGELWFWTYLQLAGKTITVLRGYTPVNNPSTARRAFEEFSGAWAAVKSTRLGLARASIWAAGAGGAIFALPFVKAFVAPTPFAFLFPWVQAGVLLFAMRQAEHWVVALIDRLAESGRWEPRFQVLARLGAQVAVYGAGVIAAMFAYGVTLPYILTWIGGTALGVSLAGNTIFSNLLQAFYLVYFQPFRIGDIVQISGIIGKVIDLNWWYVVLEHKDKTFTLVPYSVVGSSPFGKPDPRTADLSRPLSKTEKKAAAAAAAPPATPAQVK